MVLVKCFYTNIMENGPVTLTAGTAHANFPLYRIYDRDIGKIFKTTTAVTTTIHLDQGASGNRPAERLLIPAGHNLSGETLQIEHSPNDSAWTDALGGTWVQGDNLLINKSWSSLTRRYWRFTVTGTPAAAPEIAEIFISPAYTFEQNPAVQWGALDDIFNVENLITASGQDRFIVHGTQKKRRQYNLVKISDTQKDNLITLYDAWAGSQPFWLEDHNGTIIYGKLAGPLDLQQEDETTGSTGYYSGSFPFTEVLP